MEYIISTPNEEESKRVQDILFLAGKEWIISGKNHSYTGAPFLIANNDNNISFCDNIEYVETRIGAGARTVNAYRILKMFPPLPTEKMIEVDGKQWSESTLKEMIKRYANE